VNWNFQASTLEAARLLRAASGDEVDLRLDDQTGRFQAAIYPTPCYSHPRYCLFGCPSEPMLEDQLREEAAFYDRARCAGSGFTDTRFGNILGLDHLLKSKFEFALLFEPQTERVRAYFLLNDCPLPDTYWILHRSTARRVRAALHFDSTGNVAAISLREPLVDEAQLRTDALPPVHCAVTQHRDRVRSGNSR